MKFSCKDVVSAIKYLLVGGSTALLELVIFYLLSGFLSLAVANVAAVSISTFFNFVLNKIWAFERREWSTRSVVLYLLLFAFNTTFSSVFISGMATLNMMPVIAKVLSMCCIVCWNFILYRNVVFK